MWAVLVALALLVTACSDSTPPPTLATGTTATTSTSTTVTTTLPPTTTTTTTTTMATTTQSPDVRLAEIQRMVHEALVGRLQAMYDKDPAALSPWVGSQKVFDRTIESMDRVVFTEIPTLDNVAVTVEDLLLDRVDCVVTLVSIDVRKVAEGADEIGRDVSVWWPDDSGVLSVAAFWGVGTPEQVWMDECDVAPRGVTP